jgi:hypothetical protein
MDTRETPRIGNRGDALELLETIIENLSGGRKNNGLIIESLETLRDALERGIL